MNSSMNRRSATIVAALFTFPIALALEAGTRISLALIGTLLFIGLAVYALLTAHRIHRAATAPPPEYAQLDAHAKKLTGQGLSHDAVREKLLAAGWDTTKVDLVLHGAHRPDDSVEKLMFYVQDQIRKQKPKDQIRQQLLTAQWPERLVNLVLE